MGSGELPGILRPSGAEQWANCAGSFVMQARFPQEEDEQTRAGTAAHWYVTECVQGRDWPVGTISPNGVVLDDEMIECGATFLAYAATLGLPRWVEHRLTMHGLIHPDCEGTPDIFSVDHSTHTIDIGDYKYGHRYVDPYRNRQLCCYFAGVMEREGLTWEMIKGYRVRFTIVQPRNYHPSGPIRTWDTLGWKVRELVDWLYVAARAAKAPDAPTQTGAWCRDCTARHACPALLHVGAAILDMAGESVPMALPNDALGLQITKLKTARDRIDALLDGLSTVALEKVKKGERVAGWGAERGRGRERWNIPVPEVIALGEAMGIPTAKPATITPNQARLAGLDPLLVKEFSEVPHGEHKLIPVDTDAAAKAFG